ncbi:MAG: hypothetical protein WBO46_24375 [Caldilineaceae bacterium]
MVTDGEPISEKDAPSRLYANWEETPGEAANVDVPARIASTEARLKVVPEIGVSLT